MLSHRSTGKISPSEDERNKQLWLKRSAKLKRECARDIESDDPLEPFIKPAYQSIATFGIHEDRTATKAKNPSPCEVAHGRDKHLFEGFGDQDVFRRESQVLALYIGWWMREIQLCLATAMIDEIMPLVVALDNRIVWRGMGFEGRLKKWWKDVQQHKDTILSWNTKKIREYCRPGNTMSDWISVELVEDLAALFEAVLEAAAEHNAQGAPLPVLKACVEGRTARLLAGYVKGKGRGMMQVIDGDSGELVHYRDDAWYHRLEKAWVRILGGEFYRDDVVLGHDWVNTCRWWVDNIRFDLEDIGVDINWKLLEYHWADTFPPCAGVRRFGVELSRDVQGPVNRNARRDARMGID